MIENLKIMHDYFNRNPIDFILVYYVTFAIGSFLDGFFWGVKPVEKKDEEAN